MSSTPKMEEEIKIPVPWGHIAGKKSGMPNSQVVLCLHGLQDNAGTFDRLIPLLPQNFTYVAIDLPGHGKSSHFHRGLPLVYMHFVFSIKLIIDFYQWDKIILIGHSLGAQFAVVFAAIYPEYCLKLILLDGLAPNIVKDKKLFKYYRRHFDELQEVENKVLTKTPPSHKYEEALERFIGNRFSELTRESAEILIKRSLIKSGDGVRFSTDQRLKKIFRYPLNKKQLMTLLDSINCPTLILVASVSFNLLLDRFGLDYNAYIERINLTQGLPNYKVKIVEGNHDVHLNNAPLVAEHVSLFLLSTKSAL